MTDQQTQPFRDYLEEEFFEDTGIPLTDKTIGFFSCYLAGRVRGVRSVQPEHPLNKVPKLFQPKVQVNPDVAEEQQTSS